jgi:hypothetical protein
VDRVKRAMLVIVPKMTLVLRDQEWRQPARRDRELVAKSLEDGTWSTDSHSSHGWVPSRCCT